jgi:ABC-2 type transport system ATP-binding protein
VTDVVLRVEGLAKTFRKPITGRQVEAVRGVSFEVHRGETFGFLGPNGAGKTTTIKSLVGLIRPTAGVIEIMGVRVPNAPVMAHVGFLPENPYIYPYLTPREFIALTARLSGVERAALGERVAAVLERVGLGKAMDRSARSLSKGMLQRLALAATIVHEPEILVLDEPMSGLDPVGRKDVRDIILQEKNQGRTVFFSSHILTDVEMLCDRVCILRQGEVALSGALRELLTEQTLRREVTLRGVTAELESELRAVTSVTRGSAGMVVLEVDGELALRDVIRRAFDVGAQLESVTPKRETLEQLFVRRAF